MTTDHDALPVDEAVRAVRTSSRRKQVLDAAVTVMQRTGFHQMSMQALADEAGVSVGLIYKYFGGKEDVLLATILAILDAFRDQLEPAMDAVGDDPVERLAAGMRRYIEIVDENLHATVLTYRESRTLDDAGRARIKELEVESSAPLRAALDAGIDAGVMNPVDVDLMVFDIMLLAHGWALKHWHFGAIYTLDEYIRLQTRFVLNTLLPAERRDDYAQLLT
ncbi:MULTISPECIES: TetR/AcrR family transcriptional regulator [Rhodococcus]|uniref:TetR/AcrR family transcriptional regulator n=1 Tax=Rhodococcus aetherivorans TaxID=191292 RepID=A0A059MVH5_9NOCA|nr:MULTISPECIES: TetR/AcrR family transcriptional regulator [Rhodococcus]NCL77845.1 HTH-type transcriptional regulator BetI [Rhodococcus sp. YH1]AKE88929.1 TetR family transcriptional regulator [Rhodococcus aetherivorans]KDE15138.1 TetR family transcriptional regulator [Rhodococcus aetherivorans]MBC2591381.1 TetR/AcrR family transcriptional regulator [Rhodococcus aetherivorans]MDV6294422.1 TetR/AcrR family transcriptional regulator [Rhodococcus aetherivorans]